MSRHYSINELGYKIFIRPDMLEYLERFKEKDKSIFDQLGLAINKLKEDPHRNKILKSPKKRIQKKRHSARAGNYRIIYEINDNTTPKEIIILKIGHRKEVYKKLDNL